MSIEEVKEGLSKKEEFILMLIQLDSMGLLGVLIMLNINISSDPVLLSDEEYLKGIYQQCVSSFSAMSDKGQECLLEIVKEAVADGFESDNSN